VKPIPQSTFEKPLTIIDYIAHLAQCHTVSDVLDVGDQLPRSIATDERFIKAQAARCAAIVRTKAVA
jgi:hypothetical protein